MADKPTKQDLTLRQEELRIAKESLATNKELLKIQRRKGVLNEGDVQIQRNIANVLQDQVKYDKYSVNERRKITALSKKLLDLSEKVYTFDVKGLGTTTKSDKIQQQILKTQQNIRVLGLQRNKIGAKGSELQKEINDNINLQIASTQKVTAELEKQRDAAKEIEGSKIANTFGVMGTMLGKIPLLSEFAPGFKAAEEAAREAGAEVTLFSKGMVDASEYSKVKLAEFGPDAKVEGFFGNTEDEVDNLQKAADKAQKKLDKGGLKKDETVKLQKTVKEGKEAKVGKTETLYGAAAKSALEAGTADLKGVNKTQLEIAAGFKHISKELAKVIALFLVKALFDANKAVTDIQKNLGVSRGEAMKLNVEFNYMADTSNDLLVTHKSLAQALGALNSAYGTALSFSEETLVTSAKLLQSKLMEGEATSNLSMMARINGQTLEGSLKSQEDAVNALNAEHNTRISLRGVLNEANKITGQIAAQLGANPAAIGAAVIKAKALGMELKEVAAAGKSMLDFESSIEAELTAELMLGKQLNLEKARLAALTGDYETLTEEINKNVGDFGDFTKLNVLQQDALAASMGMSTDALSNQLMKKANLEELAQQALDRGEKQHAADLMALNTQQKFEQAVLKIKDAFLSMMVVLEPIAWTMGIIAEAMGTWPGMIAMAVIGLGVLIKAAKIFKALEIGAAIARIWGSAFGRLGPIAGLVVAAGATAGLVMAISKYAKAGDVMSPADGKTQISTKEGGLFELSKNDDVAAGPGILDKLKSKAMGLVGGLTGGFGGGIESLANAFNNLISIVTSKFDLLIQTITEKQGEGNNLQKSTSENLTTNLSTLAATQDKHGDMMKKLAIGVAAAALPFGMGTLAAGAISADIMGGINTEPNIETVAEIERQRVENEQPTELAAKLDDIKKVLEKRQTINLKVSNSLKYDAFEDNKITNLAGNKSQEKINESSFI